MGTSTIEFTDDRDQCENIENDVEGEGNELHQNGEYNKT